MHVCVCDFIIVMTMTMMGERQFLAAAGAIFFRVSDSDTRPHSMPVTGLD